MLRVTGAPPVIIIFGRRFYEFPPLLLPRFLLGAAAAECLRRAPEPAPTAAGARGWGAALLPDLLLLGGFAAAAGAPWSGGADPGFGHRAARSGYEFMFDVVLCPVWALAFYLWCAPPPPPPPESGGPAPGLLAASSPSATPLPRFGAIFLP